MMKSRGDGWVLVGPTAFKAVVRRAERLGCVRFACISATETIRPRLFGRGRFSFGAVSHRRPRRRALRFVGRIVVHFGSTPPSEVFTFGQFFPEYPFSDAKNGKNSSIFNLSSRRMGIPHQIAELWTKRMSRTPQKKPHKSGVATHEAAICSASRSRQCKP